MATAPTVLSHWYQLVENLQASPMEFFSSVEHAVEQKQLPEAERSRVDHFEGGAFSAKREYLRVRRGRLVFDICGAPFGNGFFFSWWLGELRSGPAKLLGIFAAFLLLLWIGFKISFLMGTFTLLVVIPAILWFLARNPPGELAGWDDPLLVIPFFGILYERWFRPQTYYRIDTTLMFQQSIHLAVLEVVDDLTTAKGLRALSERERQPILRDFLRQ